MCSLERGIQWQGVGVARTKRSKMQKGGERSTGKRRRRDKDTKGIKERRKDGFLH
jgi:hypothetical protein